MPSLAGATGWLNSKPLNAADLRGHVVLVDFWTYSCINCLRTIPYINAWNAQYKDAGLIIIGVHTPEFAFEKDPDNVRKAIRELSIAYPVALDDNYKVWEAFNNNYWPADYLIDTDGNVRHHEFGEGGYDETERSIQALLKERNGTVSFNGLVSVSGSGAEAPSAGHIKSPETYVGYDRADNVASPGGLRQDMTFVYSVPSQLKLNQWGLAGKWTDHSEVANLDAPRGRIVFRFHARDLHLVLGSSPDGKPIRFRVTIDGHAPGADHGTDTDEQGNGRIMEHRLYQLVRQKGNVADHTFAIEFLDSGAQAFAFTFG
jgi:thiol-disulfide isomerase/thioredoxin